MNRVVSRNVDQITPEVLPPVHREGPVRMLFISIQALGLKSNGREMERATAERDDVDAVHIRLERTPLFKLATGRLPGPLGRSGWDFSQPRRAWAWGRMIRGWLRRTLPLDRFDAIHVITRTHATPVAVELERVDPERRIVLAIAMDATLRADRREFANAPAEASLPSRLNLAGELRAFRRMDLAVCRTKWCADSLVEDYGYPRESTMLVYPSPSRPDRFRTPFDGDTSRPVRIGMVGNPFHRKGGDRLVNWFADRWQDRAELHIVCRDAVIPEGVRNVHWRTGMPREELMSSFYPSIDILALPTRRDHITWVLCEAAASGVCGVGPRMSGIPEAVIHGETGFIVDGNRDEGFIEAIERLLDDRGLIDQFGAAARHHAETVMTREKNYPPIIDRMIEMVNERTA